MALKSYRTSDYRTIQQGEVAPVLDEEIIRSLQLVHMLLRSYTNENDIYALPDRRMYADMLLSVPYSMYVFAIVLIQALRILISWIIQSPAQSRYAS